MALIHVIDTSKDYWTHGPVAIDPSLVVAVAAVGFEDSEKLKNFNDTQDIGKVCSVTLKQPVCVKTSLEPEHKNEMSSVLLVLGGFIEISTKLGLDADKEISELSRLYCE